MILSRNKHLNFVSGVVDIIISNAHKNVVKF